MKLIPENELPEEKQHKVSEQEWDEDELDIEEIMEESQIDGYNQAVRVIKSKARELDVEKVEKMILKEFPRLRNFMGYHMERTSLRIAESLSQAINNGECWK